MSLEHTHPLVRLGALTFEADDETLFREVHSLVDPDATMRLNGKESCVADYLQHVMELRSGMNDGLLTVVDTVWDSRQPPSTVAARVLVRMDLKDGTVARGESHLIGCLGGDGRLTKMTEIGRLISDEDDPAECQ